MTQRRNGSLPGQSEGASELAAERRRKQNGNGDEADPVDLLSDAQKESEVRRLARLSRVAYERERGPSAKRLGFGVTRLDQIVRPYRDKPLPNGQGQPVELPAPEPWPEPVEGARLASALAAFFADHAALASCAADALALWAVHAHCFDAFKVTPRLHVKSAVKGSGKSTVLGLLQLVTPRAITTETVSQAALFRLIDATQPTVLIDEGDTFLRDDDDLRAIINAGISAGTPAIRCVGDDQQVRAFNVHAPVALASIGALPSTIEDRSIRVVMKRRLRSETIAPLDDAARHVAGRLLRQAARWCADHRMRLASANPNMGGLINRDADRWWALYAIAGMAGGAWPERPRRAGGAGPGRR
jgi:hypothetical protein